MDDLFIFLKDNNIVLYYLIAINLITFIVFAIDKIKAMKDKYRINELTLIMLCFVGGSVGGLLAMLITRHKIRKPKFYILVPLFLLLQIASIVYLLIKY